MGVMVVSEEGSREEATKIGASNMHDSLAYLDFVRKHDCQVNPHHGLGEPHHLNRVGMGRNRKKPMIEHYSAIAVCRDCHSFLESKDRDKFCRVNKFNPYSANARILAEYLWSKNA